MNADNILILRLCHDLITPFNAINLGIDALEISSEDSIIDGIRESTEKANSILKYMRELFSENDDMQTTPQMAQAIILDFLNKYKITISIESKQNMISGFVNKILLFNGIIAKEIMPLGGQVQFDIDESGTIISKYRGVHLIKPTFDFNDDNINYRSIMRYQLKKYLDANNYIVKVDQMGDELILLEKKL